MNTNSSATAASRATAPAQPPVAEPMVPWSRQIWRDYGYLWVQFLLCSFALTYFLLVPSLFGGLLVTVVGLFAVGGLIIGARAWGLMYRGLDSYLLRSDVPAPPPFIRPPGFWHTLAAMLVDATGWRALLYMFISFPLALVSWIISTVWLAIGAGGLTYWIWWRSLPYQTMYDGSRHHGFAITGIDWYWFADTPFRQALMALLGVAFIFMWAPVTRGFTTLFALLGRILLGPTSGAVRVAELRRQRASAVEDADVKLRRIERELHDGTQARLVSIAMQLGEAREDLGARTESATASATHLVEAAHTSTKEALTELREIVRGIHPPALDSGIAVAITTLAARTSLPVAVQIGPDVDSAPLAPAIGSLAYYTVAELLTNVVRHSGATRAEVVVERSSNDRGTGWLRLRVSDNGQGGATILAGTPGLGGTGLSGIAKRVAAVDGRFSLTSPAGGPTVVDISLPSAV